MEVATKTNEIGGYLITSWREEPEIYGGVGEPSHPPQVGHHPELLAQHLQHLLERGGVHQLILSPKLQVSTSVEVSSFRKYNYNFFKISTPPP